MICNELYQGQGLGNQLWNYVVARIIASKRGCPFAILGRDNFKGADFMSLDFGIELQDGSSPEGGPPTKLPRGINHYYRERQEVLCGTNIDISRPDPRLLEIPAGTKFDGNCQAVSYLDGWREQILAWLEFKPEEAPSQALSRPACLIHFRGGDFATQPDVFLPAAYYLRAMEHLLKIDSRITFYCVTDQPELARKTLPGVAIIGSALAGKPDGRKAAHHFGGAVGTDFNLLRQADHLIIPNSSFSWWAAYLNQKSPTVVAPKYWARHNTSNGYWSTSDIVTDGFTYLDRQGNFFSAATCRQEKEIFERSPGIFCPPSRQASLLSTRPLRQLLGRLAAFFRARRKQKQSPAGKVYDVFIFFNELDLLEIRLNILAPHVDYFVLIEATRTFTGQPKPLYYQENRERFKKFAEKIIHHVVTDMPDSAAELRDRLLRPDISPTEKDIINDCLTTDNVPAGQAQWLREFYQKESARHALNGLEDDDICFISDVDEIWNPAARIPYRPGRIYKLRQRVYVYFLNNRSSEPWAGTLTARYRDIKGRSLNHLDTPGKTKYKYINNGGWHFTFQGGAEAVRKKIESYGHQEYNRSEITSKIDEMLAKNEDFIGRRFKFRLDESGLPGYILNNKERYKHLLK